MTDFVKTDHDKPRLDLLPAEAINAMGRAFGYGAKKYAPGNWSKCDDPGRYVAATMRHLVAWNGGELLDDESGLSHLDHALASLAMLVGLVERAAATARLATAEDDLRRERDRWRMAAEAAGEEVRRLKAILGERPVDRRVHDVLTGHILPDHEAR